MPEFSADDLSRRILDLRLLDSRQLDSVWAEIRTRNVSLEEFKNHLLGKQLLTNYQLEKILKGERDGYFYGKYRVLYIVGVGTFARVYRAVHVQTDRVVAVKVLRRRYRTDPVQVELFLREARMGERLRHFNIVRIHDVSDDIAAPYMVMEFVEGPTLRDFMKMRKKLDLPTALSLITDVVTGLDYAQKLGVTHRDLKLSNVLVTSTGRAKLVDFGLATIAESDDKLLTASPNARAIDYVALERGTGVRKNDPRSDIYFTGCILYNMLTGVPPLFETRDRLQRMNISRFEHIKPINQVEPDLLLSMAGVVNRSLCWQPAARYQEFREMLADLKKVKAIVEQGEQRSSESGEQPAAEPSPAEKFADEGHGRTVMLIESQAEMQNMLRDQLKRRGYRVLITSNPALALQRLEDDHKVADCAVFSAQELGAEALAAFNRLGELEQTAEIPAILLIDQRNPEVVAAAKTAPHRVLLSMPLRLKELREQLLRLLGAKG